jgi:hypothetical protein
MGGRFCGCALGNELPNERRAAQIRVRRNPDERISGWLVHGMLVLPVLSKKGD